MSSSALSEIWACGGEEKDELERNVRTQSDASPELLEDYDYMTKEYDFSIRWRNECGKYVCADKKIAADSDILVEAPLIVWPIRGCVDLLSFKFCENCLQLQPVDTPSLLEKTDTPMKVEGGPSSKNSNANNAMNNGSTQASINFPEEQKEEKNGEKVRKEGGEANLGEVCVTESDTGEESKIYFCSKVCAEQALGDAASAWLHSSSSSYDLWNLDEEAKSDSAAEGTGKWVGGWMSYLSYERLRRLRRAQVTHDAARDVPITLEAIGRIIAKICATTEFLHTHQSMPLDIAFGSAWRPFQRLASPANCKIEDIFDWKYAQNELKEVLADRIKNKLGEEIMEYMMSIENIQNLLGILIINSQSLNIWGVIPGWDVTAVQAAGVYTLHSCFNHNCDPNCCVTSQHYNSIITVTTLKNIAENEELTISYIPAHLPLDRRRALLFNYLFLCKCERCLRESARQAC